MSGTFVTLEGIDGAGKSTQIARLADWLRTRGLKVNITREPGGTKLGEHLRALLLDKQQAMHVEVEALLMFAARREHLAEVIMPALARGEWVVCDRFTDATYAYQGSGRGVEWTKLAVLEEWVQGSLRPDLTILLDVAPEVGQLRASSIKTPDRFEQEKQAFYERVREGYLRRAKAAPARIRVIDGSLSSEAVTRQIIALTEPLCR